MFGATGGMHATTQAPSSLTSASWLSVYPLALALAIIATAAVASGALFVLRRNATASPELAPNKVAAASQPEPMEEDEDEAVTNSPRTPAAASSSSDDGARRSFERAPASPTLAPSCLQATARPIKDGYSDAPPGLVVFTSSRSNSTPPARKGGAATAPKPCWRYSFGKAFGVPAADPPAPAAGKENAGGAVLLPSKHLPSRLFERMSKRRKKDAVLGSSPPQPPPVLAGNKHNLSALPAPQQSPKKPKILQLDAPPFGSPVASPLQPLLSNHYRNPLHSVEAFPPRAHLRRAAASPAALSSSAPSFSFMPASPPSGNLMAAAPPPLPPPAALFGTSLPAPSSFAPPPLSIPATFSPSTLSLAPSASHAAPFGTAPLTVPPPASSTTTAAAPSTPLPPASLTITLPAPTAEAAAAAPAPAAIFHLVGAQSTPPSPASTPDPAPVLFTSAPLAPPSLPGPSAPSLPGPAAAAGSKRRTEGQAPTAEAQAPEEEDGDRDADDGSEQPAKRKGRIA